MRLLITGASGQLGSYLLREVRDERGLTAWSGTSAGELFGASFLPVSLADRDGMAAAFRAARPDAVIHAAAWARLSDCHRDPDGARRINVDATAHLAELAATTGARLVLVSTDLVFDGERAPNREADTATPLSIYGRTKLEAETAALAVPRSVVARVSLLYGPSLTGRRSFFEEQVAALRNGRELILFADEWRTPLDLPTAARALVELAGSDVGGIIHMGGPERLSRLEMGQKLAAFLGQGEEGVRAVLRQDAPAPEPRPRDVSLDSSRWRGSFEAVPWPRFDEALRAMPWSG